ncbi:MAG: glycoside hydrolase family 75 protein [Verrucomicrobiales bacterium]
MKPEQFELDGVRKREAREKSRSPLALALLACVLIILLLSAAVLALWFRPAKERVVEKEPEIVVKEVEKVVYREKEVAEEPEENGDRVRNHYLQDGTDLVKLSNGIRFLPELKVAEGDIATSERKKEDSYVARYELQVRVPKPAMTLAELSAENAALGEILPGLEAMLPTAKVSPFYHQLYENKTKRLKDSLYRLDDLLTGHNFYDCQTMLELTAPGTGRKVFLLQGDMDVVSDGSDGDRLAVMPDEIVNSTHYQPFTSYGWRKTGKVPNPMIAGWEKRIENAKRELAQVGTTAARKAWLQDRMKMLERGIADMKARSFLIAEYDPFIVIPVNLLLDRKGAYVPNIGDYAVVIYGNQVYPAIVGDGGPTFKVGEASVRMARQIDARAGPYRRPVSTLGVSYLVFPRSAPEKKGAPDYEVWRRECERLLGEMGGLGEGYVLHRWEDLLPKPEPEEQAEEPEAEAGQVTGEPETAPEADQ